MEPWAWAVAALVGLSLTSVAYSCYPATARDAADPDPASGARVLTYPLLAKAFPVLLACWAVLAVTAPYLLIVRGGNAPDVQIHLDEWVAYGFPPFGPAAAITLAAAGAMAWRYFGARVSYDAAGVSRATPLGRVTFPWADVDGVTGPDWWRSFVIHAGPARRLRVGTGMHGARELFDEATRRVSARQAQGPARTKDCPRCRMPVPAYAEACRHCKTVLARPTA